MGKLWILLLFLEYVLAQIYNCPPPWLANQQSCYLFDQSEHKEYIDSLHACEEYGASLVSVNDYTEHSFVVQQIRVQGVPGLLWYTSGVVTNIATNDLKWEGDGTNIAIDAQWWQSPHDRNVNYTRIVYRTDRDPYGWTRVSRHNQLPYICEIYQTEAFRINQGNRDFTYGTNLTDPNFAARGPVFTMQPTNLVVVADSRADTPDEAFSVSLECFAEGNPLPIYKVIHRMTNGNEIEISTETDGRYTLTGGRLTILDPVESLDAGYYQWVATNAHGTAKSDMANLTFGVLGSFGNVERAPVVVQEYQSAVIACDPPQHKPAITYQWYRDRNSDFVRPDLNEYMFISNNGKLYFSEVTQLDETMYYCIIQLASGIDAEMSTGQPPSRISLPIPLDVQGQVPATWGPVIADGFIASFPNIPLRGHGLKLECLAYGTLPLIYSWSRDYYPMPEDAILSDHNRVLEILDVQLEDAGTYYCTVARDTGSRVQAVHHLIVETKPYFLLPLQHKHADVGSQLTWRCEAKAIPRAIYAWYKDGVQLVSSVNMQVHSNVLTIRKLDPAQHNGMYQCAAMNTHGMVYSSAQLRVLAFAPSFTKHPLQPTQSASIGSSTTIECSPEAAPWPEFTWTKNGISLNLPEDDGMSRVRKLANGNLFISEAQAGDAGVYACTATNVYGSDVSTGQLIVVARTVITFPPQNTVARINQTALMLCQASFPGGLDNVYEWKFNGWLISLQNHPHYRMGAVSYPGALYVTSAQYEHTGVYMCVARTTYGNVNATAHLRVQGPPGEPAGVRADISSVSPSGITLIWTEGDDHGRPIQYHSIEACTEHNRTWVTHINNIPITQTQIPGTDKHRFNVQYLKPSNGYMFRIRAANDLGVGIPSITSPIYRIQGGPPSKYPDNIGGGGGSVGLLTITWDPLPAQDQGGPGIGYKVYWRRQGTSTKYLEAIIEGNKDFHAVTVGADYYYLEYEVKVMAFNDFGEGPMSPDGIIIFSAEELPIGVATNVYAWPLNSTALYVSWQTIPNDRQNMKGKLLGYQVNFQLRFEEDASLDAISWRGETDVGVVIGLDPYTWYTVDVQVLNTAGMGPRSEVFHAKTYKSAPILYPTELRVYSQSADTVLVTWRGFGTTVDEENIEGYKVRYWQTTDDVRSAKDVITDRAESSAVVPGIMKDIVYECRVLGYSRGGDGKHSNSVFFTLGGLVPFDPTSSEIIAGASILVSHNLVISIITYLSFITVHWLVLH